MPLYFHDTGPTALRVRHGGRCVADIVRLKRGWYLITDTIFKCFHSLENVIDLLERAEQRHEEEKL